MLRAQNRKIKKKSYYSIYIYNQIFLIYSSLKFDYVQLISNHFPFHENDLVICYLFTTLLLSNVTIPRRKNCRLLRNAFIQKRF